MSTRRDREILNSVVNPLLPLGEAAFDDQRPLPDDLKDEEEDTEAVRKSIELERRAIAACDDGRLSEALALVTEAVDMAPNRPAPYNNRAQVYRLLGDSDSAIADLEAAIRLSGGRGRSACQAFCQRGLIHKRDGRDDDAMEDFKRSARLGSNFATMLLAQFNPYAAMCNKMLKNVFEALEAGNESVVNPFENADPTQKKG